MNEFIKAAKKLPVRRFFNTNRAIDKSLAFVGASALLLVGAKLLLNSIGDLTGSEEIVNQVNNFKPRR